MLKSHNEVNRARGKLAEQGILQIGAEDDRLDSSENIIDKEKVDDHSVNRNDLKSWAPMHQKLLLLCE